MQTGVCVCERDSFILVGFCVSDLEILSWHFYSFFFSNTRGLPNGTTPGRPCALGAPGLCSLPRGQPRLTQCFPSQPVSRVETRAPNTNWRLIALERSFTWAGNAVALRTGRRGGGVRSHGAQRVGPALAWVSFSPQASGWASCPSCLEAPSPTAPFNCCSHYTCGGSPGGPTFPLPTLKGTAPSQDRPVTLSHSFGDSPSSWDVITQPTPSPAHHITP